jgi:hypothetical protein
VLGLWFVLYINSDPKSHAGSFLVATQCAGNTRVEIYRRRKDSSEWHSHTQYPDWPEVDYIQTGFVNPEERERLCPECKRIEAKMFPQPAR